MLRKFALASVAAVIALASCQTASAFWGRHGGSSGGSSGGYGSSGGSSGGYYGGSSGGSSGGYYGSSGGSSGGGFFGHHRRSYWGGYGSSGGSSGGYYGSSGGSSGGYYGSSGGSSGGYGSSGGSSGGYSTMSPGTDVIVPGGTPMGTPPAPPMGTPAAPAPAPAPAPMTSIRSAILTVQVPGEAQIFVNGLATTSTGSTRRYVSNGLEPGFSYTYELRAEVVRDGKTVTETKTVKVKAGESANVNFGLDSSKDNQLVTEPARTSLTLHVPAEAKVYLSGNPTNSFGETREFSTTKLASGAEWKDYVVRVEFEQDGKLVTKEKTITLAAGEQRELSIGFDVDKIASSNR